MNLTKSHKAYFKAAKSMSELSNFKQHHIGAVAVYGHKIISSGCNSCKTNPMQKRLNIHRFDADTPATLHAELSCLLPLINRKDIDFSNVSLYIYREYKNKTPAISRPCPSCMALIRELGIRKLYYTGDSSYINEEIIY
jgi:deoxycytidylate deaminase